MFSGRIYPASAGLWSVTYQETTQFRPSNGNPFAIGQGPERAKFGPAQALASQRRVEKLGK
jgi:hypothetical protein